MTENNSFHIGKCDVCDKQTLITEMPSALDRNFKYNYCLKCIDDGVEPYSICLETVFSFGWDELNRPTQNRIKRSLLKIGKTLNDLREEVNEIDKAYIEWCESELGSDGNLY